MRTINLTKLSTKKMIKYTNWKTNFPKENKGNRLSTATTSSFKNELTPLIARREEFPSRCHFTKISVEFSSQK